MLTLHFVGGPRDGQTRQYDGDKAPHSAGCVTEAMAAGMFGVYKLDSIGGDLKSATMRWVELTPNPRRR